MCTHHETQPPTDLMTITTLPSSSDLLNLLLLTSLAHKVNNQHAIETRTHPPDHLTT
jgi:hypothetical protein